MGNRYIKNGKVLFVAKGLGEKYMTMTSKNGYSYHRVKSPALPPRGTYEDAQVDLDSYAQKNKLQLVKMVTRPCPGIETR